MSWWRLLWQPSPLAFQSEFWCCVLIISKALVKEKKIPSGDRCIWRQPWEVSSNVTTEKKKQWYLRNGILSCWKVSSLQYDMGLHTGIFSQVCLLMNAGVIKTFIGKLSNIRINSYSLWNGAKHSETPPGGGMWLWALKENTHPSGNLVLRFMAWEDNEISQVFTRGMPYHKTSHNEFS